MSLLSSPQMATKHVTFNEAITERVRPLYYKTFNLVFEGWNRTGFIHEIRGQVVGMLVCNRDKGTLISDVAVDDRYRGQGVGKALIQAAVSLYQDCWLYIDLNDAMLPHAIKLYRGFEPVSVDGDMIRLVYTGHDHSNYIMALVNGHLHRKYGCMWKRDVELQVYDRYPAMFNDLNPFVLKTGDGNYMLYSPSPVAFTSSAATLWPYICQYLMTVNPEDLGRVVLHDVLKHYKMDPTALVDLHGPLIVFIRPLLAVSLYRKGARALELT